MVKTRVLFVCTGNSARSQMAEAFLNSLSGGRFESRSAGVSPSGINPLTIIVMAEVGVGMEGHRSKHIDEFLGKERFDYFITLCSHASATCPAVLPGMGKRLHWDIEDPWSIAGGEEEKLKGFRRIRDRIHDLVIDLISAADKRGTRNQG